MNTRTKAKRYVLYARKSSESEDRQVASIESQFEVMRKLAEEQGLAIVAELHESQSAFKAGRQQFNRMVQMITAGEVDGIIVWKLSRISRNALDAGMIIDLLQNSKIKHIRTIDKDWYPEDNVLMMYVEFGLTNQFSKDLAVDTNRGLERKASRGWYPYAAVPLGYMHTPYKQLGDEEIVCDPERFDKVGVILKEFLQGGYCGEEMFRKARNEVKLLGRNNKPITRSAFYRMLDNKFYAGLFEFPTDSGNWIQGKHKAALSVDEWEEIQFILHGNRSKSHNTKQTNIPYRGLLVCATCGCSITSDPPRYKQLKNGKTLVYTYYHCTGKKGRCHQKYVTIESLEQQLKSTIIRYSSIPSELVLWGLRQLTQEIIEKDGIKLQYKANLEKELLEKEQASKKLLDHLLSGLVTEAEYTEKKSTLKVEIENLKEQIAKYKDPLESVSGRAKRLQEDAWEKFSTGDTFKKREILYAIGSNPRLNSGKFEISVDPYLECLAGAPNDLVERIKRFEPTNQPNNWDRIGSILSENSIWGG